MEQIFFNVPLSKLEPIFKRWFKEANAETQHLIAKDPTNTPKKWLDLNELIEYDPEKRTKPTWYSKVSKGEVPFHKKGKKLYFLKSEIDEWLKSGKRKTNAEIDQEAEAYLSNKKKGLK